MSKPLVPSTSNSRLESIDRSVHFYSEEEERLNILTHGFGFLASIVGTIFLIQKSYHIESTLQFLSFLAYGCSLMILYAASTAYHSAKDEYRRRKLNIVDHAAIYVLIAGTYSPLTIITLEGRTGWTIFAIVWMCALVGVILKFFFTGRYNLLSTSMYIAMGWLILFVIKPLAAALPTSALILLVLGGILYTIGAVFYSIDKLKYNHAIFHIFVLGGSLSHFLAIYWYV